MSHEDRDLAPEWKAFFQRRKIQRQLPPEMRARVMARVQEIAAARGARPVRSASVGLPVGKSGELPVKPSVEMSVGMSVGRPVVTASPPRSRFAWRVAFAVALAVALGTIGAVAALRARRPVVVTAQGVAERRAHSAAASTSVPASPASPLVAEASQPVGEPGAGSAANAAPTRTAPGHVHVAHRRQLGLHGGDPFEAELRVLQPAHAAFERGDWAGALRLVLEHARAFPGSHFAEEREALRVDCLARLGRKGEAHRAGAAFASRFPHSALLARVRAASE